MTYKIYATGTFFALVDFGYYLFANSCLKDCLHLPLFMYVLSDWAPGAVNGNELSEVSAVFLERRDDLSMLVRRRPCWIAVDAMPV